MAYELSLTAGQFGVLESNVQRRIEEVKDLRAEMQEADQQVGVSMANELLFALEGIHNKMLEASAKVARERATQGGKLKWMDHNKKEMGK